DYSCQSADGNFNWIF
nr:immunoglobulin light chain junction region [Macaca mulatta]MOX33942.1 immunoglobulin light chain junction region [Macaca mulatta]MOX34031.1 immunoglobulin light chain junction region [Macaca mulatta]MOX34178.1 immunoglobulin light chain junction region [Macaca mulatta]MOX34224.1 immunoglobulin light chain junction region [Macaca mulatta]